MEVNANPVCRQEPQARKEGCSIQVYPWEPVCPGSSPLGGLWLGRMQTCTSVSKCQPAPRAAGVRKAGPARKETKRCQLNVS